MKVTTVQGVIITERSLQAGYSNTMTRHTAYLRTFQFMMEKGLRTHSPTNNTDNPIYVKVS